MALLLETEANSSKPTASHGHLREVPALIEVQEAHFMANIARNRSKRHLRIDAMHTLIWVKIGSKHSPCMQFTFYTVYPFNPVHNVLGVVKSSI